MNRFTSEAKVGIFFLICAAIFVFAWSKVLDLRLRSSFELNARFPTAEGLVSGAQVQIAGIKVGTIKSLKYDADSGRVTALLELRKEYENSIPKDSKVVIRSKGLLGDKFVAIEPGRPNARKLKSGETVESVFEPASPEKVLETMGIVAQDMQVIVKDARKRIIDEKGGERMDRIITNSDQFTQNLNELLGKNKEKIQRSIDNTDKSLAGIEQIVARNRDKINKTLDSLHSASAGLDEMVGRNKTKVNTSVDGVERFSNSLDKSSGKFEKTVSDMEALTRDLRAGKGTMGRLISDDQLYQQISALVGDARGVAAKIEHGPGTVGRLINDPEMYDEARVGPSGI